MVREVRAGESQASVAKRHGVSGSNLGKWCIRLQQEAPRLLPVRVVDERTRRLEILVGVVRVAFEEGTAPAYVAAIARALSS